MPQLSFLFFFPSYSGYKTNTSQICHSVMLAIRWLSTNHITGKIPLANIWLFIFSAFNNEKESVFNQSGNHLQNRKTFLIISNIQLITTHYLYNHSVFTKTESRQTVQTDRFIRKKMDGKCIEFFLIKN